MKTDVALGLILISLVLGLLGGIPIGRQVESRAFGREVRDSLAVLEQRVGDVVKAYGLLVHCEAVAVHQTLEEGWEMVQVLCPVGVGPRPEEAR